MSRPFSYNDENFTVIDNLLFIHFRDDNARSKNEPILQIPPSIYERMITNSLVLTAQLAGNEKNAGSVGGTITEVDGKHFIALLDSRGKATNPRYYIGFIPMKNI